MKRILIFTLILILMLSLFPAAFAENPAHFVLPVLPDGHPEDHTPAVPEPEFSFHMSDDAVFMASGQYTEGILDISVTQSGDYFSGVTWTASTTGGSGDYFYEFTIVEPTNEDGKTVYYYCAGQNNGSNVFSYTFVENGEYQLWVDVSDTQQGIWSRNTLEISAHAAGHDPLTFTVSPSGQYFIQPTTWTINATGGSGNYEYYMELRIIGLDLDSNTVTYNHGYTADNTMTYQFLASGSYELCVWVKDINTNTVKFNRFPFEAYSSAFPSVNDQVNALVAEAATAGCESDFETALWLHDWLTSHANYDLSYSHYGPDGVLLGGTGVCDSYSKAFMLLLQAANIDTARAVNADHSWNVLQIAGDWYYVDATWDDPVESSTSAPGGFEHHNYFCIPDEILGMDHPDYSTPHECTSYEYNYYAQDGEGTLWANSFAGNVESALLSGDIFFSVDLPSYYIVEGSYYSGYGTPVFVLAEKVMLMLAQQRDYYYDIEPVPLRFFKGLSSDTRVYASVNTDGRMLTLPQNLSRIGAGAFENDISILAVSVPTSVTQIDDAAFAGCRGLWSVFIPESVVTFGDNIFDKSNGHLTLYVVESSPAAQYAAANGYKYQFVSN